MTDDDIESSEFARFEAKRGTMNQRISGLWLRENVNFMTSMIRDRDAISIPVPIDYEAEMDER